MLRQAQNAKGIDNTHAIGMALGPDEMPSYQLFTLHCSGPNITKETRVGVVLMFVRASTIPNNECGSATPVVKAGSKNEPPHWALSLWQPEPHVGAAATEDHEASWLASRLMYIVAHREALALRRGKL